MKLKTIVPTNTNALQPIASIEDIGPSDATKYLLSNPLNRKIAVATLFSYVRQMKDGAWKVNGNSICFSRTGRLLDGQHRLTAIVESGTTQKFVVVRNLEESAFQTIDTGKRRSRGDVLSIAGFTNANVLASACGMVKVSNLSSTWDGNLRKTRGITNAEILSIAEDHPNLIDVMKDSQNNDRKICRKILSHSLLVFTTYWLSMIDEESAAVFFDGLEYGANLDMGSPIAALRTRLLTDESLSGGSDTQRKKKLHFLFKAWNAWREDKKILRLSWSEKTLFETPR